MTPRSETLQATPKNDGRWTPDCKIAVVELCAGRDMDVETDAALCMLISALFEGEGKVDGRHRPRPGQIRDGIVG